MNTSSSTVNKTSTSAFLGGLSGDERKRLGAMFGVIFFLLIGGTLLMWAATSGHYKLGDGTVFGWGTGVLALTLGMRHAFDADHISAIDNTTRKLMSEGQRPLGVGFFFSLGHSSVVTRTRHSPKFWNQIIWARRVKNDNSSLHHYTGLIGTTGWRRLPFVVVAALQSRCSGISVLQVFKKMREGLYNEEELEKHLNSRGFMMRFFWTNRPPNRC
jgi:high-affinity nickel-transport protein